MLADRILTLARDRARRREMARAAHRLARPDAAKVIVDKALEIADHRIGDRR
jgi:UDP-N-acetylglucosamine:LPS N-acetylglucosamine transferase